MNFLSNLYRGLRSLFQKSRVDRELDDELAAFAEASAADKERAGMSREAAIRAARIEIGSVAAVKHKVWSARWESIPENLLKDLRFAIRQLLRSPGFAIIAVLSLALGIGANTAIFSLLNAVLLRPLPVQNPKELVLFGDGRARGSTGSIPEGSWRLFSYPFFHDLQQKETCFSGIAAVDSIQFASKASISGGAYQTAHVDLVSGSFFSVMGVPAFLGRTLGESDDAVPGGGPVAVASYTWFQRHFNGGSSALGTTIRIESHDYTLISVARPGFFGTTVGEPTDLWVPLAMETEVSPGWNGLNNKFFQSLYLIGRLKPGVTEARAGAETNLLFHSIMRDYLGPKPTQQHLDSLAHASVELTPGAQGIPRLRHGASLPLKILMGIVALVLLIACANIANMLLARGVARTREVAVRMALGASRRRIVLQLLTESVLLASLGAAAGVALAWKASALLLNMSRRGPDPVLLDVTPDAVVLAFTLGITAVTALLFGTLPAFRASGIEFTPALKEGRGSSQAATRGALARSLIVGQIALSVVLMMAAGLFVRSLPWASRSLRGARSTRRTCRLRPRSRSSTKPWRAASSSAIGHRFAIGETPDHPGEMEIVGVVKDAKYTSLNEGTLMAAYFPCTQNVGFFSNFAVRYAPGANRQEIISRTRHAIAEINSNILVDRVSSLEEQVDYSIATQSLIARLSSFFGILAVFLACIGVYGLLSYSVARRTSELGIRLALGAQSSTLLWLILRECVLLLVVGLAVGIPIALTSTRILKSLLYELSPLDPASVLIAIAAVVCMTITAAWLPARRATRIDPSEALRTE